MASNEQPPRPHVPRPLHPWDSQRRRVVCAADPQFLKVTGKIDNKDFKGAFKYTPLPIRITLIATFVTGIILIAVGVFFDFRRAWPDLVFLPNLITSLLGLMVGVPVVFFLISTFVDRRTESVTSDKVQQLTANSWDSFRQQLTDYASDELLHVAEVVVPKLVHDYNECMREVRVLMEAGDEAGAQALLQETSRKLGAPFQTTFTQLPDKISHQLDWHVVANRWKFIDEKGRAQRFANDLLWFSAAVEKMLLGIFDGKVDAVDVLFDRLFVGDQPRSFFPPWTR